VRSAVLGLSASSSSTSGWPPELAGAISSAIVFVVVFIALSALSRLVAVPLVDTLFAAAAWTTTPENRSGFVQDISLRVARVRTFNNEHLTVPNSVLTGDVIKNYDKNGTLRLKFTFRIGFRDDIDRATDIVLKEARATEGILAEPELSVKLVEINEASFGLQSRIWIHDPGDSDFPGIRGQFVQSVTERFERKGITIPYPHRTIEGRLDGTGGGNPRPLFED